MAAIEKKRGSEPFGFVGHVFGFGRPLAFECFGFPAFKPHAHAAGAGMSAASTLFNFSIFPSRRRFFSTHSASVRLCGRQRPCCF